MQPAQQESKAKSLRYITQALYESTRWAKKEASEA